MGPCTASVLITLYHRSIFSLVSSFRGALVPPAPLSINGAEWLRGGGGYEEVRCVAVAVQGSFALCSVALVVLLQHQIIAGSPASLQKLVPPSDSEEKSKSSSLFQQLARSAPLLFSAFKKNLSSRIPSMAFVLSNGDKWAVTASNWQRTGPLNLLSLGAGT